ncbi:hypothetical protein NPX13_g10247 [Xylaria arbuscula]|uniref:U6 small nuclear RNA (adenine-(43)-N(6))-methyltransferase n=1 Tax=Xylaria arbuscula TaxID=114810 RepID=A0A9W8TI32_9PEZI|nr:hypothetical protein NPX13_g10247 [Xylaria arbuscula]
MKQQCSEAKDACTPGWGENGVTLNDEDVAHRKRESQGTRRARSATDEDVVAQTSCKRRRPHSPEGESGIYSEDYFRDLFSVEPDFRRLGSKYPEFGVMLKDDVHLDFTDPVAVMQLTKTLLKEDFGLHIRLRPDRLCPPVPNRHNYILWLKDLLDSTSSSYSQHYEPGRRVTGLDVGTGASLIYPLLGCVHRPAWRFIATDIDAESIQSARENARLNNLESRIRIIHRTASDTLIPALPHEAIDFVMVNPPFYASDTELLELAAQKSRPPPSACTGAPVEMVCEGGEVQFVERLINESLTVRDRIQWYTAMLGKQSSMEALIDVLKRNGINNFAVTTFIQGSKTRRWALGWSFLTRRPTPAVSRGCGSFLAKTMLPPLTTATIYEASAQGHTPSGQSLQRILRDTMDSLDLRSWAWDEQRFRGVGFSDGNVWSRAHRRRRAREGALASQLENKTSLSGVTTCAFGFSVSVQTSDAPESGSSSTTSTTTTTVTLCWLQGDDESLFETFSGMLRRRLREDTKRPV